ncbi:MAG: methyltransferase domain-containing protein [Comamonadaceae bacterium]
MNDQIIGLHDWFATPPGRYLLEWERAQLDSAVADIFGYHALQLGLSELDALRANRMPHRWLASAVPTPGAALLTDFSALPFPASSLDLVVLPHSLELARDPHATLREVERVLVPEGRVVICGLNPVSLWGFRQKRARLYRRLGFGKKFMPQEECIGYWRLRDWLRLLGFEVEVGHFGCYRPALAGETWLRRFAWMDWIGQRWWPIFGAVYFLVAVKRVRGVTLLSPAWRAARSVAAAPVSVVGSATLNRSETIIDATMGKTD